jgi:uncharacterized protein YneF (UPF0154 family)
MHRMMIAIALIVAVIAGAWLSQRARTDAGKEPQIQLAGCINKKCS